MLTQNPTLIIDVASIPDFRRIELAKGALALTEQVFSMPGAEDRYQAWLKERKAKQKGRPNRPVNVGHSSTKKLIDREEHENEQPSPAYRGCH